MSTPSNRTQRRSGIFTMQTLRQWLPVGAIGGMGIAVLACNGTAKTGEKRKEFTQAETAKLQAMLAEHDPASYRIVLPVYRDSKIVGSQVQGTLALSKVERLAAASGIAFNPNDNIQTIFSSSACDAGSHVCTQSAALDLGDTVQKILQNVDQDAYVWVR